MARILILAPLEPKHDVYAYLKARLIAEGCNPILVDLSLEAETPELNADIQRDEVLRFAGWDSPYVERMSRTDLLTALVSGGQVIVQRELSEGRIDGIIAVGGGSATSVATDIMRCLPFGFPKVMVSSVASGDTRPFVGIKDIVMFNAVTDVHGLNKISRRVMANAAAAVCSMAKVTLADDDYQPKGIIGLSIFSVTMPCASRARTLLEEAGYEVIGFFAGGMGGLAMESLLREGLIDGVFDLTITELADELVGGIMGAGPERLEAAGTRGVPQVVAPGALDMVNFGAFNTIPAQFEGRRFYRHHPHATLMRTSPEENTRLGQWIAEKLNQARGPTVFLWPERGFSRLSIEGQPFYNPLADRAFFEALSAHLSPKVPIRRVDTDINDHRFAETAVDTLLEMMAGEGRMPRSSTAQ